MVLHELYTKLSPNAAAAVTQIILRDLRPILYPVQEIHYSSALLDYNTKSLTTISLWDFMKYWDPTGRLGKAYRLLGTLESAAESFENPEIKLAPQIGHLITVSLFYLSPRVPFTSFLICGTVDTKMSQGPKLHPLSQAS